MNMFWLRVRCMWANKYTCASLIGLVVGCILLYPAMHMRMWAWIWVDSIVITLSCLVIVLTGFAQSTVNGYLRTMEHFERFNRLELRFVYEVVGRAYCFERGSILAVGELIRKHGDRVIKDLIDEAS